MDAKFFEAFEEMVGAIPMSRDPQCGAWQRGPTSMPQGYDAGGFQPGGRVQTV